jgi:VIT1/CCC1 family predicted Fe2+/Mn2+ transporter
MNGTSLKKSKTRPILKKTIPPLRFSRWTENKTMLKDHDHDALAIQKRLDEGPKAEYIKEWVYGGIDGVVTTFAIIAGVAGASLSPTIILILGFANLIADGFSMAAGAYSATKADDDNYNRLRLREEVHVEKHYDGEIEETRQILAKKGFDGEELEQMVTAISKDKDNWINWMMNEEYGISSPIHSPMSAALNTFAAFVVCGFMPVMPFVIGMESSIVWALIFSGFTFFLIGSFKSLWSVKSMWREGLETFLIGMTAAGISYLIGYGLKTYIG